MLEPDERPSLHLFVPSVLLAALPLPPVLPSVRLAALHDLTSVLLALLDELFSLLTGLTSELPALPDELFSQLPALTSVLPALPALLPAVLLSARQAVPSQRVFLLRCLPFGQPSLPTKKVLEPISGGSRNPRQRAKGRVGGARHLKVWESS